MRARFEWVLVFLASLSIGTCVEVMAKERPWKPGASVELIMASGGVGGTYLPAGRWDRQALEGHCTGSKRDGSGYRGLCG